MAYLVLLSGLYYFIVVVFVNPFNSLISKLLFGILNISCELSLVYMYVPVLFWMTFVKVVIFVQSRLCTDYHDQKTEQHT